MNKQDKIKRGVTKYDYAFARDDQGSKLPDPNPELPYSVYVGWDRINKRPYIGFCRRYHARVVKHMGDLCLKQHPNKNLQEAFDRDGDMLEFSIVAKCKTKKAAKATEAALIAGYPNAYNIERHEGCL